jgi:carbon storage regulator CsrA
MLVLSRKEGERISIGDNITLVVSKVNGNRVTIGIEAPRDVKIVRGELHSQPAMEIDLREISLGEISLGEISLGETILGSEVKRRPSLRDRAASVLPMQRQVG